jgi:hypothetical protein
MPFALEDFDSNCMLLEMFGGRRMEVSNLREHIG